MWQIGLTVFFVLFGLACFIYAVSLSETSVTITFPQSVRMIEIKIGKKNKGAEQ